MQRINENNSDLELWYLDGGGVPVYRYQEIPFTGIVEEYNEGNTILLAENEYLNRFQEGWIKTYYSNGQLETEYQCHNNETVIGTYKEYN